MAPCLQVVHLRNHTAGVPAFFSFQLDPGDPVFGVSPANGVVGPQSSAAITVAFRAPAAAHQWRRMVCLIKV